MSQIGAFGGAPGCNVDPEGVQAKGPFHDLAWGLGDRVEEKVDSCVVGGGTPESEGPSKVRGLQRMERWCTCHELDWALLPNGGEARGLGVGSSLVQRSVSGTSRDAPSLAWPWAPWEAGVDGEAAALSVCLSLLPRPVHPSGCGWVNLSPPPWPPLLASSTCALSGLARACRHRIRLGDSESHYYISPSSRARVSHPVGVPLDFSGASQGHVGLGLRTPGLGAQP